MSLMGMKSIFFLFIVYLLLEFVTMIRIILHFSYVVLHHFCATYFHSEKRY